jgi:predicted metal-dependent HD superfamily phosphohydrolase
MNDNVHQKWRGLLHCWSVAVPLADQIYAEICGHYTEPNRFYHTLDHIQSVLETVEKLESYARRPNAVKLAAWLHDVIYDSRASDNEERSAVYAERLCESLSILEGRLIADLIRKTKTHDAGGDIDAQVLIDADLAVLGVNEPDYLAYTQKIRQEYSWVPDQEYRVGRSRILRQFQTRPRIYHFLTDLEAPARRNLTAELARLAAG